MLCQIRFFAVENKWIYTLFIHTCKSLYFQGITKVIHIIHRVIHI